MEQKASQQPQTFTQTTVQQLPSIPSFCPAETISGLSVDPQLMSHAAMFLASTGLPVPLPSTIELVRTIPIPQMEIQTVDGTTINASNATTVGINGTTMIKAIDSASTTLKTNLVSPYFTTLATAGTPCSACTCMNGGNLTIPTVQPTAVITGVAAPTNVGQANVTPPTIAATNVSTDAGATITNLSGNSATATTRSVTNCDRERFTCGECGKSFAYKSYLKIHARVHTGERPYQCRQCGKAFTEANVLRDHLIIHSGRKAHQCQVCGKQFALKSYLKVHARTHSGTRPYECHICGKRFTGAKGLRDHLVIHSGEKAHQCERCGKCFALKSYLKVHLRTHSGDRPQHTCQICHKRFTESNTLRDHLTIHSGVKAHECNVCGKSFALRGYLRVHTQTHNGCASNSKSDNELATMVPATMVAPVSLMPTGQVSQPATAPATPAPSQATAVVQQTTAIQTASQPPPQTNPSTPQMSATVTSQPLQTAAPPQTSNTQPTIATTM